MRRRPIPLDIEDVHGPAQLEMCGSTAVPHILEDEIESLLLDSGIPFELTQVIIPKLLVLVSQESRKETAVAINEVMQRLGSSAAALALKAVVCGAGDESHRQLARRAKVSHTCMDKQIQMIAERLGVATGPQCRGNCSPTTKAKGKLHDQNYF